MRLLTLSLIVVMTSMTGFLALECSSLASAVVTLGKGLSLWRAGHGQLCIYVFEGEVDLHSTTSPFLLY